MDPILGDGDPAFPQKEPMTSDCHGMSLRDYFAAKTAPALLRLCQHDAHEGQYWQDYLSYCAGLSYKMADAMLKARARRG